MSGNTSDQSFPGSARRKNRNPLSDKDIPVIFSAFDNSRHDYFDKQSSHDKGTAFIYDERMLLHKNIWFPNFLECPERFSATIDKCTTYGLLSRCLIINPEPATDDFLTLYHQTKYIEQIKQTTTMEDNELKQLSATLDSVYFNKHTDLSARLSVGSWIQAVDLIHHGDVRNAFCLVRPPGHHALTNEACGFCIYNNVAIAANYAIEKLNYNRILIVDWDVHHGNTTQYAFYDNPKVLFISIHRYDNGEFWPNLRESNYDFIGTGRGRGFNVNIALNDKDIGDSDYLTIFHRIVLPLAYEFDPELVLVSAGYDSSFGCPVGQLNLSPSLYAHLTHKLMAFAEGKVIVGLEGGYYLDTLSESVGHTLSALLGDPMPSLDPMKPINPSVLETISNCISTLSFRWKFLHIYPLLNDNVLFPDISHLKLQSWSDVKVPNFEPTDKHHNVEDKLSIEKRFDYLKNAHPIAGNNKISGTCLVYDNRMQNHKNEEDPTYPENPERIKHTYALLKQLGLKRRCKCIEARYATRTELLRVHTEEYVNTIASTVNMEQTALNDFGASENSVYFNCVSVFFLNLIICSLVTDFEKYIMVFYLNGMALIRPPGHHALKDRCMGFCFFNNVAIGARHAQQVYGLERIAIIDWDVHHGNGTAEIFEDDPNILYISVHRFDHGRYFPNSDFSSSQFCGTGEGLGRTIHIAWNGRDVKDGDYIVAFTNIIIPILYEFRPQLILVSAGFDAAHGDKLGRLGVSPECFAHLTHLLMTVVHLNPSVYTLNHRKNSPIISTPTRQTRQRLQQEKSISYSGGLVLALEGGYQITALSQCVAHCVAALLGDNCPRLASNLSISEKSCKSMQQTIEIHSNYWNMLKGFDPVNRYYDQDSIRRPVIVHSKLNNLSLNDKQLVTKCTSTPGDNNNHLDDEFSQLFKTKLTLNVNSSLNNTSDRLSSTSISKHLPERQCVDEQNSYETLNNNGGSTVAKTSGLVIDSSESHQHHQQQQPSTSNGSGFISEDIHDFFGLPSSHELTSQVFAVTPLSWCPHLISVQNNPNWKPDINSLCNSCNHSSENWVCLSCYSVYCGRYANSHMIEHFNTTKHSIVLSYADLSTWCYQCESYVHNEVLLNMKRAVYQAKFGEDMPGSS
ncbi:histone deacetylase,putative [Schistosoma mansoni]|uniref:histone deacetylase,putative n=1 Tax=Schistosoma mansoni TaxID=6183 RepID=UPI00022C86D4|nr:histone deacetylase,putative [Schistosoma mansoni]|eukprot:XP_018645482.1 histone deacetylase,putative [Schistosoma mansoni]